MSDAREPTPEENGAERAVDELRRLVTGYQSAQAIHVAAELRVADQMSADPRPSHELAEAVGAHPDALYRLLRALAALGVFREHENRRFSLGRMGERLRSDARPSLRPFAILAGQEYQRQAWGGLLHSVTTGENAFATVHGMSNWTYRERHPEQNAIFNAAMTANSERVHAALLRAFPFGRFRRLADIGGGQGALLAAILAANPGVHGVLFDQPHVVATVVPTLRAVAGRCDVVGGDMFEAVPSGCDAYVMKYVLHDWPDGDCLRILGACRRAMERAASLVVIERLVGPPNEDATTKLADLGMMVGPGGRERTREEFTDLLQRGGFALDEVVRTDTSLNVLRATPVSR